MKEIALSIAGSSTSLRVKCSRLLNTKYPAIPPSTATTLPSPSIPFLLIDPINPALAVAHDMKLPTTVANDPMIIIHSMGGGFLALLDGGGGMFIIESISWERISHTPFNTLLNVCLFEPILCEILLLIEKPYHGIL